VSFDDARKEAIARADNSTTRKWSIEMRHPVFPAPFRMVQYREDLDLTLEASAPVNPGETVSFQGTAFEFNEPGEATQPDPTARITIDGVPGVLQPFVRLAIRTRAPIAVTLRSLLFSSKTETVVSVLRVIHLELRRAKVDKTSITGTMGFTNPANQPFPSKKYSIETYPGLA